MSRNAYSDQQAEAREEKEMDEYYDALYNQKEMDEYYESLHNQKEIEEVCDVIEGADKIYQGKWYNINNGTIVKCIAIIQEDIIVGLLYSGVSREPITKYFTMSNLNNGKNEYEPIQTFEKIGYQAYLSWTYTNI